MSNIEKSKLPTIEKASAFQKAFTEINPELAKTITISQAVEFIRLFDKWEAETIQKIKERRKNEQ